MKKKKEIEKELVELEREMQSPGFWSEKVKAQEKVSRYNELKDEAEGVGKYDKKEAILSILSGAGGLDAEDFSAMLFRMYRRYAEEKGWSLEILHENRNEQGGYRNLTFEISGKNAYGTLKNESGVHRLVRLSPFNAKSQRHTSFSMVEVMPKFEKLGEVELKEDDLGFDFSKSSGPGGQNVNKRETAVRVTHKPSGLSVSASSERSQERNREKALEILQGKLYHIREEERKKKEKGLSISSSTEIEWGNQIRSYVLHPYKMVKDHRTGVEEREVEKVLDGEIDSFIEGEKELDE
jgi:peptide chain release factor 2